MRSCASIIKRLNHPCRGLLHGSFMKNYDSMKIKTILFTALTAFALLPTAAQPALQLRADNIDAVIAAMTLEEKANLVVGDGMGGFSARPVIGSSSSIVPGAAGTTKAIPRLGIIKGNATLAVKKQIKTVHNVLKPQVKLTSLKLAQ